MRSFKLAGFTFKRFAKDSALVRVAMVAITLVPLLYGALYLWAFWDPYGRLDKMPVAVVNLDRPVTVDGTLYHAGADLVDGMLDGNDVGWKVVSAQEASAGLRARRYYLSLTIPSDFSAKLATANTKTPQRASLRVVAQESSNMLASQIMSRVFGEVRAAANASSLKTYLDLIFLGYSDAHDGFKTASLGAKDLASGLNDAKSGSKKLESGLDDADTGALTLAAGLVDLKTGAYKASAGAAQVATGTAVLASGLVDAKSGATKLAAGATSLAGGAETAQSGAATVASGTASLSTGLSSAKAGASQVAAGATSVKGGASLLAASLDQLWAGAKTLSSAAGDLSAGATQVDDGVSDAVSKIGDASTGAAQVNGGAAAVDSALHAYLAAHPEAATDTDFAAALGASAQVKAGSAALASGLSDAKTDAATLKAGSGQVKDGAAALATGAKQLADGLGAADTGGASLASGASDLAAGSAGLSAGVGSAASGASALAAGSAQLAAGTSALASGAKTVAAGTTSLSAGVRTAAAGATKLAVGSRTLAAGTSTLASGAESAASGASTLSDGVGQLDVGMATLADGIVTAAAGAKDLHSGLASGTAQIPNYSKSVRTANDDMMSDPVSLTTKRQGMVPTYGTGFAPYFLPLALWVGAMLTFFIIKPLPRRAIAAGAPAYVTTMAGYLPAAGVGIAQAVILLAVVQFGLGLHPVSVAAFYAIGILTALVSVAILQLLNAALGAAGKLVSIVLLMLQLTSAAGTFPVQMIPPFFQAVHPFLPMTYVIDAMRQAISGGDLHSALLSCGVLALFGVVSLVGTIAAASRAQTYTMERLHPSLEL